MEVRNKSFKIMERNCDDEKRERERERERKREKEREIRGKSVTNEEKSPRNVTLEREGR